LKLISVPDLVWLNAAAVGETGGATGIRDAGALEAVVARPCVGYGGEELFPTLFDKAAAIIESVIRRHPFVDGNKRTGLLAGAAMLYLAGYNFAAPRDQMVEVPVRVAEHKITLEELSRWFEKHARQQGKRS
jgi:death-on-curing protein